MIGAIIGDIVGSRFEFKIIAAKTLSSLAWLLCYGRQYYDPCRSESDYGSFQNKAAIVMAMMTNFIRSSRLECKVHAGNRSIPQLRLWRQIYQWFSAIIPVPIKAMETERRCE